MVMFGNGNVWSEWKEEFLNSRITGIKSFFPEHSTQRQLSLHLCLPELQPSVASLKLKSGEHAF